MKYYFLNFCFLFSVLVFIDFGLSPIWDFLNNILEITPINYFGNEKSISFLISIIIIAPLVETSVFQLLIKYLLDLTFLKFTKNKTIYYSSVSGILFGLTHIYSIVHIAKACVGGFFFMFFFLKVLNNKDRTNAFLFVTITHAIWNLFVWFYRNT